MIPFRLDPGIPVGLEAHILAAMQKWSAGTPIHFQAHSGEADYVEFRLVPDSAFDISSTGRLGGRQFIEVRPDAREANVLHEIGHTIGLHHEHSRADRASFIQVLIDNVDTAGRKAYDFVRDLLENRISDRAIGPYDFESVMHYPPSMFQTAAGTATFLVLQPGIDVSQIGVWAAPSQGDVQAIRTLYQPV